MRPGRLRETLVFCVAVALHAWLYTHGFGALFGMSHMEPGTYPQPERLLWQIVVAFTGLPLLIPMSQVGVGRALFTAYTDPLVVLNSSIAVGIAFFVAQAIARRSQLSGRTGDEEMGGLMVGPKTTQLIGVLDDLEEVLRVLGQESWADWMQDSSQRLRRASFSGITHLLDAYGGMGSLNDLPVVLGDARWERAKQLSGRAWRLADEIRREAEFE